MGSQAQNDIEDLKRRLDNLQSSITNLTNISNRINAVENNISNLQSNITNITNRVDTAEDNISNIQSNIGDGNSGGLGTWILKYEHDGTVTDESVLDNAFEELPENGILAVKENQE